MLFEPLDIGVLSSEKKVLQTYLVIPVKNDILLQYVIIVECLEDMGNLGHQLREVLAH